MSDESKVCPCCLTEYSRLDAPDEFERVALFMVAKGPAMARAFARLSRGKPRNVSQEERARRADRMRQAQKLRHPTKPVPENNPIIS